jgi:2-octaprenylphenol hydroxylase
MQKSAELFSQQLTEALDFKLGKLIIISGRSQFPLIMRHVDEYASENCVLVGDAAHTIHPLAGLGVNLGLMDAACLTQVLIDARESKKRLGNLRILRRYTRWRKSENTCIINMMRALQEIFSVDTASSNLIRSMGINMIDRCIPIKNHLMKIAMGQSSDLPTFLQM